ncbi:hypothetical protein VZT92_004879 [Zoarces viviparus]|uniref:PARP4 MVP-ID C-terminal domain-containing protein n=1 Tax=Zoarces viviparus TaxID=48416 RepID=A0AAW1FQV5_ZOAVI
MPAMASYKSRGKRQSDRPPVRGACYSGHQEELSRRGPPPPVRPDAEQPAAAARRFRRLSHQPASLRKSSDPEGPQLKWTKIFQMQHSEGYWELTTELGELMNVNVDLFANVFLKNKGIQSLGARAHADILRLVATLLVLQLMRVEKLEEGKLLRTLFSLDESSLPRPARWAEVKRAVDWVCWADRQYPCVCSRLEFGLSWETSTRQLLGFEGLPPFSALTGLKLQKTVGHLLVL